MNPPAGTANESSRKDIPVIPGAESFVMGRGKKALLMLHGWTSSPREMRVLAERFKGKYRCAGPLLAGHGTRPEDLVGTTWKEHFNQVTDAFAELSVKYRDISVIGLSYGALLALHLAARRKVSRVILLAPFLFSKSKLFHLKAESEIVPHLPDFIQNLRKKGAGPVNNPETLKDHIAYNTMPVKPLKSVVDCAHSCRELLPKIRCPSLIIHSTGDQTADFDGGVTLIKELGSADKTLVALSQSNHILTLDYEQEKVFSTIEDWLFHR